MHKFMYTCLSLFLFRFWYAVNVCVFYLLQMVRCVYFVYIDVHCTCIYIVSLRGKGRENLPCLEMSPPPLLLTKSDQTKSSPLLLTKSDQTKPSPLLLTKSNQNKPMQTKTTQQLLLYVNSTLLGLY